MRENFKPSNNLNQEKSIVMKNQKSIRSMLALASAVIPSLAATVFAGVADPVAVVSVVVPTNQTILSATPFARPVEASGTIDSWSNVSTNAVLNLTLNAGESIPSLANSFSDLNADTSYVLEVVDGDAIGLILEAIENTASTVTVRGNIPNTLTIAAGSKFNLRKAWTLTSLFGSAADTNNVFGAGTTANSAAVKANVQLYDVDSGSLSTYYIATTSGRNWRRVGSTANCNHAPIGLGKGFVVINKQTNSNFAFTLSGDYRTARTRLICPPNKKLLIGNPGLFDVTLSDSTIPVTSPTKTTGIPGNADTYGFWLIASKSFDNYKIGGTTTTNVQTNNGVVVPPGAAGYRVGGGSTRVNPTIAKYTSLLVTPHVTNAANVITVAPSLIAQ